jgi:hypothetical protein
MRPPDGQGAAQAATRASTSITTVTSSPALSEPEKLKAQALSADRAMRRAGKLALEARAIAHGACLARGRA